MGEAHPHGRCQVASRDHWASGEHPPVAGYQVGSPQAQEEEGNDVEHPAYPLFSLKLIQHQQTPAARRIAVLPDSQQGRRRGAPAEAGQPVGRGLATRPRAMEGPVLADGWHELDRLHLSAVVDEKDELEVDKLGGQEDECKEQHEAQRVIGTEGAVLEGALVLLADEGVRAHVQHRRERHGYRQGPHHAYDGQACPEGQPLSVKAVVGDGQVPRHANAEQHEGSVETGEHAQKGDHFASQRAVRPG